MRFGRWLGTRTGKMISSILLLGVGIGLTVGLLWATNALGWRAWRLQEVQRFIGAELPNGARDIQFATEQQKTRIIWLRFALPAEADLTDFVSRMGLKAELRMGYTPFPGTSPIEAALTWWTPKAAQTYSGLHVIHDGKMLEVLLDQTNAVSPTIYLRAYALSMN